MTKVLVYGSLKSDQPNADFLTDEKYLGSFKTQYPCFIMKSLGSFPYVSPYGKGKIWGELYDVSDEGLENLDLLEGNGVFYTRELVWVEGLGEKAWMYMIREDEMPVEDLPDGKVHKISNKNGNVEYNWNP